MKYSGIGGTFDSQTVLENNLSSNALLFPQISKYIVREYPQYALTFLTEGLGRYASEKVVGGRQFEWFVKGRLKKKGTLALAATTNASANPLTLPGGATQKDTVGASNAGVEIETEEALDPFDVIRFKGGQQAIVTQDAPAGTAAAGNFRYIIKWQNTGTGIDIGGSTPTAGFAKADDFGIVGSAHPEKSAQGYGSTTYPEKYTNFTTISRAAGEISGSAATDITWVESNGERLWYFTQENDIRERFLYELEVSRLYGQATATTAGVSSLSSTGASANIISGDGLLAQIASGNVANHAGTITEKKITEFMADLKFQNGEGDASYVVLTGTRGMEKFDRAMKDFYIHNQVNATQANHYGVGSLLYDYEDGVSLGGNFRSYHFMGMKMTLMYHPCFDDPTIHHDYDANGDLKESSKMVFLNVGQAAPGVSNLEVIVKGAGGINRGFVTKYIPGMIDLFDQRSVKAASSSDSFKVEMLSESGIILRRPLSCGILAY